LATLVLGLGNAILSDDGVGWRVVDQLKARFDINGLTFAHSSSSGIRLLEEIIGYDRLIIIDAIQTESGLAGEISRFTMDEFKDTRHLCSSHGINFATAVELGEKLGEHIPQKIVVYAIQVADVTHFGEQCTPEVEKAIPRAVAMVAEELDGS
jgi:hydrogenase maturation protease